MSFLSQNSDFWSISTSQTGCAHLRRPRPNIYFMSLCLPWKRQKSCIPAILKFGTYRESALQPFHGASRWDSFWRREFCSHHLTYAMKQLNATISFSVESINTYYPLPPPTTLVFNFIVTPTILSSICPRSLTLHLLLRYSHCRSAWFKGMDDQQPPTTQQQQH